MKIYSKILAAAALSLALMGSGAGVAQAMPNGGGDTIGGQLRQVGVCLDALFNDQAYYQANCRNDIAVNLPGSRGGGKGEEEEEEVDGGGR